MISVHTSSGSIRGARQNILSGADGEMYETGENGSVCAVIAEKLVPLSMLTVSERQCA